MVADGTRNILKRQPLNGSIPEYIARLGSHALGSANPFE
jgi:hypothetical protein